MSISSISTAIIPYTRPKTPMEFIKSEVEKGLTITYDLTCKVDELSESQLNAIAKIFGGASDIRYDSLLCDS